MDRDQEQLEVMEATSTDEKEVIDSGPEDSKGEAKSTVSGGELDFQVSMRFRRGARQVEGVHPIGILPPPVGADSSPDPKGRMPVAIGRVMVVPTRVDLDLGPGDQLAETSDVRVRRAYSDHEDVDELTSDPGLHVHPIEMTTRNVFGNAYSEEIRNRA